MRIESFWAKGFRSLRDVRLDGLGPFNVFYGPNGSGKSNILAAMEAWLRLIPLGSTAIDYKDSWVGVRDFSLATPQSPMTLGGTLVDGNTPANSVAIEFVIKDVPRDRYFEIASFGGPGLSPENIDWERAFSLVTADRMPRTEVASKRPPEGTDPLSWYFRQGRLKEAFFAAQNANSSSMAQALDRFRQFVAGPPLFRPAFRSVEDPATGIRDLHERLPAPLDDHEVSLDLAGLGTAQMYWILGQAMLSGAQIIGIEEPEAHLHAPTTGRHLRELLQRLVVEKHVDQLFIATHSNLFDLDPKGYWDVSLKNGETVVERAELPEIDRKHLYEPGPAKHALQRMLEYMPKDEIVFRHGDGSPITATEMLRMLQDGDEDAVKFLEDIHGAAMRMVRVGAKKKAGG